MLALGRLWLLLAAGLILAAAPSARAGHAPPAEGLSALKRSFAVAAPTAPASRRIEVLAHVNPREDTNGSVWVHADHAYLANYGNSNTSCGSGVRVFSLRNPLRPRRVSTFARPATEPVLAGAYSDQVRIQRVRSASFRGDLAAVGLQRCRPPFDGTGGTRGFALYDVTTPSRPRLLSIVNTSPVGGSHELWLQAVGSRAYVYTAIPRAELRGSPDGITPGNPDFRIYDVSDPARPLQVGQWGIWSNLGIKPTTNEFVHSVITNRRATRAYLSYWEYGTVILDITNPASPQLLARLVDPSQAEAPHAHSTALAHKERFLIEAHEFGRFLGFTGTGYPRFWDLVNERSPRLLGRYEPPGAESSTVHDPRVAGTRAYVSWYDLGVYVLDISKPQTPRRIAHFLPGAGQDGANPWCANCTFVWEAYPHRDYFVASDMNTGLWVAKVQCLVPNVRGMTLRAARSALTRADCRTGHVRGRGRVVAQRPRAGARPRFPSAVRLTLGR